MDEKKWYQDPRKLWTFIICVSVIGFGMRMCSAREHEAKVSARSQTTWTPDELAYIESLDTDNLTAEQMRELQDMARRKAERDTSGSDAGAGTNADTGASTDDADTTTSTTDTNYTDPYIDEELSAKDFTQGRSTDFLDDPDLVDEKGRPTIHAIMELEGWQLLTLIQQHDYHLLMAPTSQNVWIQYPMSGTADGLSLVNKYGYVDPDSFAGYPKGGGSRSLFATSILYGFDSPEEALEDIAGCSAIDSSKLIDTIAAVYENSNGEHFLVVVSPADNGAHSVVVLNESALQSGLFFGGNYGKSVDKAYENYANKSLE